MFQTKFLENIKLCILYLITYFFFENRAVYYLMLKNIVQPGRPQMIIQNGVRALYAGYLRLQTRTQNAEYLLLIDGNNGYANAPQYYACLLRSRNAHLGLVYALERHFNTCTG
jgi:hypothetical protein